MTNTIFDNNDCGHEKSKMKTFKGRQIWSGSLMPRVKTKARVHVLYLCLFKFVSLHIVNVAIK